MYCQKCGQEIIANSNFCSKCGAETLPQPDHKIDNRPRLDFIGTLTKSFKYPWRNKALWFFGIFIALFSFGSSGGSNSSGSPDPLSSLGSSDSYNNLVNYLEQINIVLIITVILIIVLIVCVLSLILKNWALSAIINGTLKIEKDNKVSIKDIFKPGVKTVWRLIILNFFIPLAFAFLLVIILILGTILFSLIPQPAGIIIGLIVGLIFLIALIPLFVYLFVVWIMASRFIVVKKEGPVLAITSARKLIKNNFWITFAYSFVSGLVVGSGSCLGMIFLIVTLILFFVALFAGNYILLIFIGLFVFIAFVFYIIVVGYFCAFKETGLTLWWNDLKKVKEFEKKDN